MDSKIKSALDAAGTAADYSARATYQRGYDAGVASVEAREWALGVQVVAQAARLKQADALAVAVRDWVADGTTVILFDALAAWDAVPGMEPVATEQGRQNDDGAEVDAAEARANARLIAAAPDLLEACERLLDGGWPHAEADIELACSAIAKAKGVTP